MQRTTRSKNVSQHALDEVNCDFRGEKSSSSRFSKIGGARTKIDRRSKRVQGVQGVAGVREVTAEEEYNGGFLHLRRKIKRADYSENPSTNGDLRERERNRVEKMENKPLRKLGVLGMNTRN